MQNEFQQLLNDLADGRLDDAGRCRLDELCATDPALARRLRQESGLTALLARCGPNHAPSDLLRSVMDRLDARSPYRLRPPWYAWMFRPAVGAALAFTAMAVIGIRVGLTIHGWRTPGGGNGAAAPGRVNVVIHGGAASERRIASVPKAKIRKPAADRSAPRQYATRESLGLRTAPTATRNPQSAVGGSRTGVATEFPQTPSPRLEEFPAASSPGPQIAAVPQDPARTALPPIFRTPQNSGLPGLSSGVPPSGGMNGLAPNPAVPLSPAVPAQPAPAPRPTVNPADLADRAIAMDIYLTPIAQPSSPADAAPAPPAQPIPYTSAFAPPAASPKAQALTLKDIEVNLYAVGAENVSSHPVVGRKNTWEVQATLTPEQFRGFNQQLRASGILPGESVLRAGPITGDEKIALSHAPSATTNRYEILHGSQWTRPLERLDAATSAGARARPVPPRLSIRITVEQGSGVPR